jgi:hypothetical protein
MYDDMQGGEWFFSPYKFGQFADEAGNNRSKQTSAPAAAATEECNKYDLTADSLFLIGQS